MEMAMGTRFRETASGPPAEYGVQNRQGVTPSEMLIHEYDATTLVGLRTIVFDVAIQRTDKSGDVTIEVPHLRQLACAAAVARCLIPVRLRGSEIRTMRRILKLTLADLADALDVKTATETISRWETEAQPMGGYAEKVLRLFICEHLSKEAPGVDYQASKILELRVIDPWRTEEDYEAPAVEFSLLRMRNDGSVIDAYSAAA